MICSSPLTAFYNVKAYERTGKKNLIFNISPALGISACDYEMLQIPCGHCIECRINKAKDWATRSVLESRFHKDNYFLTLTYSDEHENIIKSIDRNSGALCDCSNLVYEDVQVFLKRLREKLRDYFNYTGLKFLCSGEYGNLSGRAHFHLLLFGCPIPDLKLHRIDKGNLFYTSKLIESCWYHSDSKNEPNGFHLLTQLDYGTACYTAKYAIKKLYGRYEKEYQHLCAVNNVEPLKAEFLQVSRAGGIGSDYFKKVLTVDDYVAYNKIQLNDGKQVQIPKFFNRLFREHPEDISNFEDWDMDNLAILENYYQVQAERIESSERFVKAHTSVPYLDYLKQRHDAFISELKFKQFCRNLHQ